MNHGPAFLSQKRMSVLKNIKNHGRQDDMDKECDIPIQKSVHYIK